MKVICIFLSMFQRLNNMQLQGQDLFNCSASRNFWQKCLHLKLLSVSIVTALSPVHTGEVEFNTVDFAESLPCGFGPIHTGNKVDCIGN